MLASLKSLLSKDDARQGAPRPTAARIAAAFAAANLVIVVLFVVVGVAGVATTGQLLAERDGLAEAEGWRLVLLAYAPLLLLAVLLPAVVLLVLLPLSRRVRRMAARLEAEALTDPLTGLANRRAFLGAIRGLHAAGEREAAVILLDLTRLRDINESVGQAAGDAALREFAARLLPAVAEIPSRRGHPPLIARLSGDEFAVVMPVHSGDRQLEEIAARLCFAATAAPVLHEGRPLVIRAAAGATAILGDDPAQALEAATMALREARRDVERPVRVFSPDRDARRLLVRRAVLDALAAGNLEGVHAVLQPVVSAKDLRVVGFEALARWDLPELGTLEPGQFLPLAAEAGHLPEIGRAARHAALGAFAGLRRAGLTAPRLALNLSAGELASPGLIPGIGRELQEVGLAPADIEFEITEEVVADGIDDATRAHLVAMQAAGAGILLDDFGTGAASLSQLLRMPVQAIKMDRSFVHAIGVDPRLERLVEATIRFGHAVGAKVVAEGVETWEQQEFLRRAGCDTLQGYFVARPMKLGVLGRWLRERPVPAGAAAEAAPH